MGKKAIITGGSRGIGSGIALKLAEEGYDIAFSYNSAEEEAKLLAEKIVEKFGVRCYYYQASLQNEGVPETFFNQAIEALGGVDLLVCNAGVSAGGSIMELEEDFLEFMINLDYKSYLLMARFAAKHMVEHGVKGNIIFITSTHGERAYSFDTVYGGLKAGLNRAVQSIACELGSHGIRINAVAPGYTRVRDDKDVGKDFNFNGMTYNELRTKTGGMIPIGREGTPADIGDAVVFLSSDEAKYITGITVRVDGGLILPGMPESNAPERNVRIWGFREHYGKPLKEQQSENKSTKGENKHE